MTDLTLAADATVSATLTLADAAPRSVVGRVLFHDGPSNTNLPVAGAVAFIAGPGVFAYTDAAGTYRIEGVPVQGAGEAAYAVTAFDNVRGLQGGTTLPPVVEGDGSPILAADILLASMSGGIDGVVLDPLGRPYGGAQVELDENIVTTSGGDGRFSFDDIAVGGWNVVAHVGDGLVAGKVGYFGQADGDDRLRRPPAVRDDPHGRLRRRERHDAVVRVAGRPLADPLPADDGRRARGDRPEGRRSDPDDDGPGRPPHARPARRTVLAHGRQPAQRQQERSTAPSTTRAR